MSENTWDEERREVWESVLEWLGRRLDEDGLEACRILLGNLNRNGLVAGYLDSL